jgi:hypothetical protein
MRLILVLLLMLGGFIGCAATPQQQEDQRWVGRLSHKIDESTQPVEQLSVIGSVAHYRPDLMQTAQGRAWYAMLEQAAMSNDRSTAELAKSCLAHFKNGLPEKDPAMDRVPEPRWWEAFRVPQKPVRDSADLLRKGRTKPDDALVVPLIQAARERFAAGDRATGMQCLQTADDCAMSLKSDAGPANSLVQVAQAYVDAGEPDRAVAVIQRAVEATEQMHDAFYYGMANYGTIITFCRASGHSELIEPMYAKLNDPLEQDAFCIAALLVNRYITPDGQRATAR